MFTVFEVKGGGMGRSERSGYPIRVENKVGRVIGTLRMSPRRRGWQRGEVGREA